MTGTVMLSAFTTKLAVYALARSFPAPFDFLRARLTSEEIPKTAARQTLTIMLGILAAVFLLLVGGATADRFDPRGAVPRARGGCASFPSC